jgi:hypothetical protein
VFHPNTLSALFLTLDLAALPKRLTYQILIPAGTVIAPFGRGDVFSLKNLTRRLQI